MSSVPETVPTVKLSDGNGIPQLGFGTLRIQPDREDSGENAAITAEGVGIALDVGYRHFDTAQSYGNERGVGLALGRSGLARDQLFITSKLSNENHRPEDVRRSVSGSLERLEIDYLDLFLIHWPLPTRYDGDYVSTWRAVVDLVAEGMIRSAGVSNFQPLHVARIVEETGVVPTVNQVELHPYLSNRAVRESAATYGFAVEAHSPLGHFGDPLLDQTIAEVAASVERTVAQVILRWHIQHGRIVIPKSSRPSRVVENFAIFDFDLSEAAMAAIDALDRGELGRVGPDPDMYGGV